MLSEAQRRNSVRVCRNIVSERSDFNDRVNQRTEKRLFHYLLPTTDVRQA